MGRPLRGNARRPPKPILAGQVIFGWGSFYFVHKFRRIPRRVGICQDQSGRGSGDALSADIRQTTKRGSLVKSNFIDRLIGIFSPQREAERLFYRSRVATVKRHLKRQKERYAAGKSFRQTGDWAPVSSNINDLLTTYNAPMRNRIRQLIRDFPFFDRAVQVLVDYTVGPGMQHKAMIKMLDGSMNRDLNQKIEDAFNFWADEADYAGNLHYYEMDRLAKRADVESGEFLVVRTQRDRAGRYLPLALQIIESEWLTDYGAKPAGNNEINMGVETNSTGLVVAYHITDPDSWGKTVRIPAERVLCKFETLRAGQLRGVSPFAPAVIVAHDLDDFMAAEIDAAKMAARYLAFVESPDLGAFQGNRVTTDDDAESGYDKVEEIESALIEYLQPGEKVTFASNERGGGAFDPFSKFILRMLAVTVDVPYELLSGDYSGLNYSSLRGVRNDMQKHFIPFQMRQVRQFHSRVYRWFMDQAVMRGRLNLPNYFANPYPYFKAYWQPPGLEPIDPLREGKAAVEQIDKLLMSPQEHAARRGRDYVDILDEIQEAKRLQADRKLEPAATSTATKTNPAAIGG